MIPADFESINQSTDLKSLSRIHSETFFEDYVINSFPQQFDEELFENISGESIICLSNFFSEFFFQILIQSFLQRFRKFCSFLFKNSFRIFSWDERHCIRKSCMGCSRSSPLIHFFFFRNSFSFKNRSSIKKISSMILKSFIQRFFFENLQGITSKVQSKI